MSTRRLVVVFFILFVVTGCERGFETVVRNESATPFVVEVDEITEKRYYPVPSGTTVLVDTVGHSNPGAETITLYTGGCAVVGPVSGYFWEGGVISLDSEGQPSFEPGRSIQISLSDLRGPSEREGAELTCEAAADRLQGGD